MIARVLDIPADQAATAAWLDEQLVGCNLHELVAELAAVHDLPLPEKAATPAALAAWLGDALPDLLARGTAALDKPRFAALLRTPSLLPAVQELVFVDGGEHWMAVMDRAALPTAAEGGATTRDGATNNGWATSDGGPRTGDRVAAGSAASADDGAMTGTRTDPALRPAVAPVAGKWSSRLPAALAALAASLFLAFATWSILQPGPAVPWGWNRPAALAAAAAPEYLENLAAAAGEWSAEVPQTEAALARRLGDLRAGCDRLIAAPHESLADADREWLVERCRAWRESIAGHLAALSASHDVVAVRAAADGTIAKLTAALRARSQEIRSRPAAA